MIPRHADTFSIKPVEMVKKVWRATWRRLAVLGLELQTLAQALADINSDQAYWPRR